MAKQFCSIFTITDKVTGKKRRVKKCRLIPTGRVGKKPPTGKKPPKPPTGKRPPEEKPEKGVFAPKLAKDVPTTAGGRRLEKERAKRLRKGERFAAVGKRKKEKEEEKKRKKAKRLRIRSIKAT